MHFCWHTWSIGVEYNHQNNLIVSGGIDTEGKYEKMTDTNTMTDDDDIFGYALTDAEFSALTADQLREAIGPGYGVIRLPDGSYTIHDWENEKGLELDDETRIARLS